MSDELNQDRVVARVEQLRAEHEKLLRIIANAYQVAGAHGAPDRILDVLANPQAASDDQVEAMLPYAFDDMVEAIGERQRAVQAALRAAVSPVAIWWTMVEAQEEVGGRPPIPEAATVLYFMGSGASTAVTAGQLREIIRAAGAAQKEARSQPMKSNPGAAIGIVEADNG